MKRSEMYWKLNDKLVKQKHMFDKYRYDKKISFKWLVDNLTDRILNEVEKQGMLPPYDGKRAIGHTDTLDYCEWEPEDETKNDPYINFFV